MPPYILGLIFGLIFIFSLGPAFFSLVQTSVQKGFKRAVLLAVGISLSDVIYVMLALAGVASLLEAPDIRMWMAIIGTIVLIAYGIYNWYKKPRIYQNEIEGGKPLSQFKYVAKGFLLNGLNPFIIVFWLGIISVVAVRYDFTYMDRVYFFTGVLTTILTTDVVKALIAHRFRAMITPQKIQWLNRGTGVILVLFGLQMVYFLVSNYWIV